MNDINPDDVKDDIASNVTAIDDVIEPNFFFLSYLRTSST